MATELEIRAAIDTANSETDLLRLTKEMRTLIGLQSQVEEGSAAFYELREAINETEGRIGDLNDSFKTLSGSGVERLDSSFALLREGFEVFDAEKIKIGFNGIGAAMSAVPVFLIAEGVKFLIENFDELVEFAKEVIDVFREEATQTKSLDKELKELQKTNESVVKSIDAQITALSGLKKNEEEIIKLQKEKIQLTIQERKLALASAIAKEKEAEAELKQRNVLLQLAGVEGQQRLRQFTALKEAQENRKQAVLELQTALAEGIKQENEQEQKRIDKAAEFIPKYKGYRAELQRIDLDFNTIKLANIDSINNAELMSSNLQLEVNAELNELKKQQDEEYTRQREGIQLQLAATTAGIFGSLSQLFEQNSIAAKTSALAEIATNTGIGFIQGLRVAQQASLGLGPAAAFAFPLFYASQVGAVLAAAAKAKQTLMSGKSGAISAPNISSGSTPTFSTGTNGAPIQTNDNNVTNLQPPTSKVVVLAKDITEVTDKVSKIKANATY